MPTKQKDGRYRLKVKVGTDENGKDIIKWASGKTKAQAEQNKQELIERFITGQEVDTDTLFGRFTVDWYNIRKKPFISPSTVKQYHNFLNNYLLPEFGERRLRSITGMDIQEYLNRYSGHTNSIVTHLHSTLRQIFRTAFADGIIPRDPMTAVRIPPTADVNHKRALTLKERRAIEHTAATHPRGMMLSILYYTGMRVGECMGLMWQDIDLTNGTIHIQRDIDYATHPHTPGKLKTPAANRVVPIEPPVMKWLTSIPQGTPDTLLFRSSTGTPIADGMVQNIWTELMVDAGLARPIPNPKYHEYRYRYKPTITPHYLRHNYITMCWEAGLDPSVTMRLVGHTNYAVTLKIYTHLNDQKIKEAATPLSAYFQTQHNKKTKAF